ncbi:hypothetical protein CSUI_009950 [Cystoisospora suis]|uniref:Transmembrane protein n=1 Tax=Cystoisospora suis TaxID=483139 RepID=A0A2C6KHV8_9APIC|nr:hypothetical protein CSUI_009950 [Cystoisospora suis]
MKGGDKPLILLLLLVFFFFLLSPYPSFVVLRWSTQLYIDIYIFSLSIYLYLSIYLSLVIPLLLLHLHLVSLSNALLYVHSSFSFLPSHFSSLCLCLFSGNDDQPFILPHRPSLSLSIYFYIHVYVCIHVSICISMYVYLCMYIYVCISMHAYLCVSLHAGYVCVFVKKVFVCSVDDFSFLGFLPKDLNDQKSMTFLLLFLLFLLSSWISSLSLFLSPKSKSNETRRLLFSPFFSFLQDVTEVSRTLLGLFFLPYE